MVGSVVALIWSMLYLIWCPWWMLCLLSVLVASVPGLVAHGDFTA